MSKVKPAAQRGAGKGSKQRTSTRQASTRKMQTGKTPGMMPEATSVSPLNEVIIHDQPMSSTLSLHDLFQQQTRQMLDRTDLDEEQKQHILVAMNCPCCGAGAFSFTARLRR